MTLSILQQEINVAFDLLRYNDYEPELCSVAVPYYETPVMCGAPDFMYEDLTAEKVMIPRSLMGMRPVFVVPVKGDSMKDAGILNGDDVIVKHDVRFEDGDVVVAWLDGETTLKTYYRDDDGEVWLVPANDDYEPIRVADYTTAYLLGKVTGIKKKSPRVPFKMIRRRMQEMKDRHRKSLTDERVRDCVTQVLSDIKVGRMWFCIYRVLADAGYLHRGRYEELAERMDELFPDNNFNINPKDIGRMDVLSFSRPFAEWDERNAPVQGKRFREYLHLAADLTALLNG